MQGKVVAANRNLGVIVVETDGDGCVIFEVSGMQIAGVSVGEVVEGDWAGASEVLLNNASNGNTIQARVQRAGVGRSEAIGSASIF